MTSSNDSSLNRTHKTLLCIFNFHVGDTKTSILYVCNVFSIASTPIFLSTDRRIDFCRHRQFQQYSRSLLYVHVTHLFVPMIHMYISRGSLPRTVAHPIFMCQPCPVGLKQSLRCHLFVFVSVVSSSCPKQRHHGQPWSS